MDQYFTSRGYSCFSINYTGSSGHGKSYREALYGRWGIADTDDVADAVSYLASQKLIDPKQVGVVGGSAGGYNVLQSLVHYPSVFAGGVCYCGVSDVAALDVETHKMESRYMDVLMGFTENTTQEEKDRVYKERSPLYRAEEIKAPLLLVHGDKDTVVPISQSYEIKERMEGARGTVEMIVLEDEGHMFKRGDSWRTVIEEGERWWRRSLLGKEQ
jgi:dipeptidyl aminopeptidase/acylaminoacyl peptidase